MNNFKGGRGFNKGGSNHGSNSKFGGGKRVGKQKHTGSDREYKPRNTEMFKATCSECGKSCEVPFNPASDKPVYCSDCFGKKITEDRKGAQEYGGRNSQPNSAKLPREQRSPRHDDSQRKSEATILDMRRQLTKMEEKLNRILEIVNPPMPAVKKSQSEKIVKNVEEVAVELKEVKAKKSTKKVAKKATKKAVAKKVAKKSSVKKVAKK